MINAHPYYYSRLKRGFDMLLAGSVLVLTLPLLLGIAGFIFIRNGWPIIYTQSRAGLDKKPFILFKFRTMNKKANQEQKKFSSQNQAPWPMFKIFNDPRFIKGGRFLSKTGLDELPQLINIFRGDMSFIGPRPLPVNEVKQLPSHWDFRFSIKPGIFSEWTLADDRHKSLTKWKRLDKRTLRRGGLGYEIRLTWKTVWKVVHSLLHD